MRQQLSNSSSPQNNRGISIYEMLWLELDKLVAQAYEKPSSGLTAEIKGMATAIAIMTNPKQPSLKAVREIAAERYRERRKAG